MAVVTAEDAAHAPPAGIDADAAFADFDAMVEGWLDDEDRHPRRKSRAAPRDADPAADAEARAPRTVCARCHSLTHNGCVQSLWILALSEPPSSIVYTCAGADAAFEGRPNLILRTTFPAPRIALSLPRVNMGLARKRQQHLHAGCLRSLPVILNNTGKNMTKFRNVEVSQILLYLP